MRRSPGGLLGILAATGIAFTLTACGGGGSGGAARPKAPDGLTASSNDSGQVTLDWNLGGGAASYNIYWDTTAGVTADTGTRITGAFPPYDHTGISNGAAYYYVVTAVKGSRESLESTEVSATPLEAPSGVAAQGGTSQVTITWSPVTGATRYNIYWSTNPGLTKQTGIAAAGVSSPYRHFGLTDGTTYFYVVTAADPSGGGSESSESIAVYSMPLPGPTGLSATVVSGDVVLDWNPVAEANAYNLYWATSPGVTPATGTRIEGIYPPYTHTGLAYGTTYYYVATATNIIGDGAESLPSQEVFAKPEILGVLDTTFNGVGYVLHDNAAGGNSDDDALDIAIDASGRILAAGYSMSPASAMETVVWRYEADGTIDTAFNGRGWVVLGDLAGGTGRDSARGIVLDASGRILVAGYGENAAANEDLVIIRLMDDGSFDTTFNGQGWVAQDNAGGGGDFEQGFDIAIDSSGKILATGYSSTTTGGVDMAIWRLNGDGTLDTTFNGQGWVTHDDAGGAGAGNLDVGLAITLDSSGRILVAGIGTGASIDDDMTIWRFNGDGTLDATFNGQGWVTHHDAGGGAADDMGQGITVDASDRILVTGRSLSPSFEDDMVTWRFRDDGTLDTTFNGMGWLVHGNAGGGNDFDEGQEIAVDSSGRILVAGASLTSPQSIALTVWRLNQDGTLDTSFGGGQGWFLAPPSQPPVGDQGLAMTLDASGRILVAGHSYDPSFAYDMVIFRIR